MQPVLESLHDSGFYGAQILVLPVAWEDGLVMFIMYLAYEVYPDSQHKTWTSRQKDSVCVCGIVD